jgi:putative tricarboxylic transport membrane protein
VKSDVVAGVVIACAAVALFALGGLAPLLGAGANRDATFWPAVMLGLLVVLSGALAAHGVWRLRAMSRTRAQPKATDGRAHKTLAILAYVPALFLLGFYVSALAYAFVLPPLLGGVRWRSSALFAAVFTAILYVVFSVGLRMELPQGYAALAWMQSSVDAR